jgi:hypothetical protein
MNWSILVIGLVGAPLLGDTLSAHDGDVPVRTRTEWGLAVCGPFVCRLAW